MMGRIDSYKPRAPLNFSLKSAVGESRAAASNDPIIPTHPTLTMEPSMLILGLLAATLGSKQHTSLDGIWGFRCDSGDGKRRRVPLLLFLSCGAVQSASGSAPTPRSVQGYGCT